MTCTTCGAAIPETAAYCPGCGAAASAAVTAAVPATRSDRRAAKSGIGAMFQALVVDNGGEVFEGSDRFDWGAFWWPGVWPFAHGQWKLGFVYWGVGLLLVGVPILEPLWLFGWGLFLGGGGYAFAAVAQPGRWESFEHLERSQRTWARAGVITLAAFLAVAAVLVLIGAFLTGMSFISGY